jgi:hypothetical protein
MWTIFPSRVDFLACLGLLLIVLTATTSHAEVNLRIVTPAGWVEFATKDDWRVVATETKFPVAVMAFQILNPADEETPDSTNLSISLIETGSKSEEASRARTEIGKSVGEAHPVVDEVGAWTTYTQPAAQGKTTYIVVDATRELADVQVWVRLAWPVIGPNPDQYHESMGRLLGDFLETVDGQLGMLEQRPGEVLRRPTP